MSVAKFTPEVRGALLERTAAGVSLPDACRDAGIRHSTVKTWISKGNAETAGAYRDFVDALEDARGQARSRPEAMDADELARVVSEAARRGSVQAMKLRLEMLQAADKAGASEEPAVDPFDELKARRARHE